MWSSSRFSAVPRFKVIPVLLGLFIDYLHGRKRLSGLTLGSWPILKKVLYLFFFRGKKRTIYLFFLSCAKPFFRPINHERGGSILSPWRNHMLVERGLRGRGDGGIWQGLEGGIDHTINVTVVCRADIPLYKWCSYVCLVSIWEKTHTLHMV